MNLDYSSRDNSRNIDNNGLFKNFVAPRMELGMEFFPNSLSKLKN